MSVNVCFQMGLYPNGTPLSWEEIKKNAWKVHKIGVLQFITIYNKYKDISGYSLKWGDEIEFNLVALNHQDKAARLSLIAPKILDKLKKFETDDPENHETKWSLELASYVIEGTPGVEPYGNCLCDINKVEINMKLRRTILYNVLKGTSVFPLCLPVFPRMGCPGFTEPQYLPDLSVSDSFPAEEIWASHPRCVHGCINTRKRRRVKIVQKIPIFRDIATPIPYIESFLQDKGTTIVPDHIYLDSVGFGSATCLQVTIQGYDINETRFLYDQLAIFCPMMLAITAGSPIHRGYLTDVDCRWGMMAEALDDRTPEERDPYNKDFYIPKSRYDCIDMYLAHPDYNDTFVPVNETAYKTLIENGIDETLAKHIAHLFIRDPLYVVKENLEQDIDNETGHFDNIQSSNWQSMRFKPPPLHSKIGWRVEFRVMEVQVTEFENAAFVVFIVLLTRTILSFKLNFLVPISKMEENMKRSIKRDAVHQEYFHFRKTIFSDNMEDKQETSTHDDKEYTLMNTDTIFNGNEFFIGIIPLIKQYLNSVDVEIEAWSTLMQYLKFISEKASGTIPTTATWIREFVHSHPDYKHDSVVGEDIAYDLIIKIKTVSEEKILCDDLQGKVIP